MNQIFLIGNLTRDPELSQTANGISVCKLSLAVNRKYKNADGERGVDYFNCTAWRKLAETVAKYLKKGNRISVIGSVETGNYEDSNGVKKPSFNVVADDIEFLTSKNSDGEKINKELQSDASASK